MKNPGPEAERAFEEALRILIARNPFFVGYYKAQKCKELDCIKIDFLIFLANFLALPVQIKSGVNARREAEYHYSKCPYVLVFRARKNQGPEKISRVIEKLVIKFLRNPMKVRVWRGTRRSSNGNR